MLPSEYEPTTLIPDLAGKVIFVTGATAGLGKRAVTEIAKHNPSKIVFTGRSSKTGQEAIDAIRKESPNTSAVEIVFIPCDLASLASVKEAAQVFLDSVAAAPRLDVFIASAGIMADLFVGYSSEVEPGLTKDGFETQFGTNHLGHAALLSFLLPTIRSTADSRVIMVSSAGHKITSSINYDTIRTDQAAFMGSWIRYGQSKLANVLYAKAVAKRYPSIISVAIHPGVIITGLTTNLSLSKRWFVYVTSTGQRLSEEDGCKNHLWAGFCDKKDIKTGEYYEPVGSNTGFSKATLSEEASDELWDWTETTLQEHYQA
ncbi:hypothetical protein HKX48_003396 [Thoreauomyces humboldtii]|nr:hypothetical protein HKX48_003396 [Thoreauomyces humboldtii]